MIFRYELGRQIVTFDFYNWLVTVATLGATEIVFDARHIRESIWPADILRRRFETILAPGPALAGLPCRKGSDGTDKHSYRLRDFVRFAKQREIVRLKSVLPPANVRYTVTLRNQVRKSRYRNSNQAAWRQFARDIGALVIEDYDDKPIHLHERMALYAGAEMNFGVICGPTFLLTLTDYPCMTFNWQLQRDFHARCGLEPGAQLPWARANQIAVWEQDSLTALHAWFNEWKSYRSG